MNIGQQGWGQATAAMKGLMQQGLGAPARSGTRRRKRKASGSRGSVRSRPKKRKASRRSSGSRLTAGSAAAKAWGRKMRALRKRK